LSPALVEGVVAGDRDIAIEISLIAGASRSPSCRRINAPAKMTKAHAERETLSVEVNIPAHADRKTTALFRHTREQLIQRELGKCWICQRTAAEAGHPLEAHHHPIERCLAEMIDWPRFAAHAKRGTVGHAYRCL
jgi:hypothetical protein